jgi:hypothetical protein
MRNFSKIERVWAALGLVVALLGQVNSSLWHNEFLGISPGKLGIMSFFPAILILFLVMRKRAR